MDTIPVLYVNPQQEHPLATGKPLIFLAIKVPQELLIAQAQLRNVQAKHKLGIVVSVPLKILMEGVISINTYIKLL
ncbi:hypothetical protein [Xanthomarina gelatinilytica]|uniref:hypothetical protein n=1 Tax=Xanthomarina gelatinilytica TaxID=1137281 RepID=UPI003AA923BA